MSPITTAGMGQIGPLTLTPGRSKALRVRWIGNPHKGQLNDQFHTHLPLVP